jgi:hypothetical protein
LFADADPGAALTVTVPLTAALAKFSDAGETAHATPVNVGAEQVNVTVLLMLLSGAIIRPAVFCCPALMESAAGFMFIEKSGRTMPR